MFVRDALTSRPTSLQLIDFVKVNSPLAPASPMMQNEGYVKHENAVTFTTSSARVQTLATFIRASRQVMDDFSELAGFLSSGLTYYVNAEEETQLLSGDNTGNNLNGLISQSRAFDTSLLPPTSAYTKLDMIGRAIEQILVAKEIPPTFLVCNPVDWWSLRLLKDGFGRYILGSPSGGGSSTPSNLFDLLPIVTNSIGVGSFLIGSGDPAAAEIRDRMELVVELSTEDADNFQRNMVTVRAEKRLALVVMRPGSYIHGTFAQSPA